MWKEKDSKLEKNFSFRSYIEATDFINKITPIAENLNHHPDILLHSYNKVRIYLFTHSESRITEKDYELAKMIDESIDYSVKS